MKITCISASNTQLVAEKGTSVRVCGLVEEIAAQNNPSDTAVKTLRLTDFELKPCHFCGSCLNHPGCPFDDDFNKIYAELIDSDALIIVIPHYACIPAKLTMIFEKLNELFYVNWYNDRSFRFPLNGKPVGIIVHGGSPDQAEPMEHMKKMLLDPTTYVLGSLGLKVVGVDDRWKNGVAFGLVDEHCISEEPGSILPSIRQDWDLIRKRVEPLVQAVLKEVHN